mgnify:CR=1 FL=1|tara:strand:+ start:146 stop:601 length:456 start_codon:yes stop_codon:yes gene_type:complete
MPSVSIIRHAKGAPGLRNLGLGPNLKPQQALKKLKFLMDNYAFWAKDRSLHQLRIMLKNSSVVTSVWIDKKLIGFGRAHSDMIFRAILWDVIVANDLQGKGFGKLIVESLINSKDIKNVEKVYLMTTNCKEFYSQIGFNISSNQTLLSLKR